MTDRKGLFTPEQESFLVGLVDDLVKFKNPFLEMVDGMVLKVLIQTADNQGLDKIPNEIKEELIQLVDAAMAKDVNAVRTLLVDLLVEKADFFKNQEASLLFFDGVSRIIMAAIDFYLQRETGTAVLPNEG